jgi:c-di-AMP phosphodiesterase-like protein
MIWLNGLFLVVGLTYFRYAIMLRTVYVLRNKWVRAILLLFNINFFVFVLRQEQRFMTIYDSFTVEDLGTPIKSLTLEQVDQLIRYFFNEINFTVVACEAMIVVLSVRFVIAYWKTTYLRLNAGNEE